MTPLQPLSTAALSRPSATQVFAVPMQRSRRRRFRPLRSLLLGGLAVLSATVPASPVEELQVRYVAAIRQSIETNWLRPASAANLDCELVVLQQPGGEVVHTRFDASCDADKATLTSLKAAVQRASPLPYAGFEAVFQPEIHLRFQYHGQ